MSFKLLKVTLCTAFLSLLVCIQSAQALTSHEGSDGYKQTPAETVVQIVITAIVMKVLHYFDLP
jgi:hypothetical protein